MKLSGIIVAFMVTLCVGCGQSASFDIQKVTSDAQAQRDRRDKDLRVITDGFNAYIQTYGFFERRLVTLIHCGESQFLAEREQETRGVFLGFMAERVEITLKDRAPVRDRATESDEVRELMDRMEGNTIGPAFDLLEREGYVFYLRDAYGRGVLETFFEISPVERAALCSGVERYKAEVLSVIDQRAKSTAPLTTAN